MTSLPAPAAAERRRRGRLAILALGWGPLLVALAVLLVSGEARNVARVLGEARPGVLAVVLLVGMALPVVHARRWQTMLQSVAATVPLPAAVDMTVSASLVNYAVPGYIGSPTKGVLARQLYGIGLGRSVPTLAAEQMLDALALALGSGVALLLAGPVAVEWVQAVADHSLLTTLLLTGTVGMLGVAVGFVLLRRFAARFLAGLASSGRMLAGDRARRGPILLLTLAYWSLNVLAVWLAAWAVGISLGLTSLMLLSNLPLLVGLISPLPGGLGLREGAMAAIAGAVGVPVAGIVAAAVLQRAVLVAALPAVLGGVRLVQYHQRRRAQ